jgi:hypothetical protein
MLVIISVPYGKNESHQPQAINVSSAACLRPRRLMAEGPKKPPHHVSLIPQRSCFLLFLLLMLILCVLVPRRVREEYE